jgi:hypothetical protein
MSVAEQLYDLANLSDGTIVDTTKHTHYPPPTLIVTPKHSGVPYSTDNPLDGYFTRKVPSCYPDPQYHHRSHSPLEEIWKSKGPPVSWLHNEQAQKIAWEREVGWRVRASETKPTGVVVEISVHRFWKEGEPTESDQAA